MREADLVKRIKTALEREYPGCFIFKTHGGLYQRVGLPDLIGCIQGRFVGVEVKLPGKERTLTKIQEITIKLIRQAGGVSFMATSVEQVLTELNKYIGDNH